MGKTLRDISKELLEKELVTKKFRDKNGNYKILEIDELKTTTPFLTIEYETGPFFGVKINCPYLKKINDELVEEEMSDEKIREIALRKDPLDDCYPHPECI